MEARPGLLPQAARKAVLLLVVLRAALPAVVVILPRAPQNSSNAWTPMVMARSTRKNLPS